ncbi:Hypothetical predicted protein [Pelobates cultripes]|uniref:Uncharacterized protein n=1 Tax=Pelobates cultripes TaxID=61616 RepID=A0AAD1RXN1_PELCU|nr:Hypothetical predicted protein [Pelobates cultripes]
MHGEGEGGSSPLLLRHQADSQKEILQFLGRDNLLGIEGTTGAETSEVQAPQSSEEAPGDAVSMESRAAGSPPVSLEMRLASLSSHHPQLVDLPSPRMSVVSLQQPAPGVQEQGCTAERSDGTLPLQEEGTITLTAVDPDSVTSVAEEMQLPQLPPPLAALYATIQARQAELEMSIQQDRENQRELLQNVITEVHSMSNILNEGVRQFTSAMVSLQQNMQRFMEMREEECIPMRAQAAHNLGITIADVDSLVRERRAQGLARRDDDD